MVLLDVFLEQICDYAGFWSFEQGAGWFNYLCWFVITYVYI
jgi:putative membrane protein